ncbi:hypothetical protein DFH07DRAFT_1020867 [Mycena maculata]|uniref:DUF913 domain-containing protein n=1 Tax=Mycena maculata TaxID=230809 RepID=A0AAD7H479_9AGAR|nr:hypothetical protein DFH07DRAFT_1020867 [Mycena maculata]
MTLRCTAHNIFQLWVTFGVLVGHFAGTAARCIRRRQRYASASTPRQEYVKSNSTASSSEGAHRQPAVTNAFQLFCKSSGVDVLVDRIEVCGPPLQIRDSFADIYFQYEIDLDLKEYGNEQRSREIYGAHGDLPVARAAILEHVLRSLHRMMQSSSTAEGLRGLIDMSILKSIKKIIKYRGPTVVLLGSRGVPVLGVFVRGGGPNYQEGLRAMRLLSESLGGPSRSTPRHAHHADRPHPPRHRSLQKTRGRPRPHYRHYPAGGAIDVQDSTAAPTVGTIHPSGARSPTYPFGGHHIQKFYWGTKETLLSRVLKHTTHLQSLHRRSAIIVEGVPERRARELLWRAQELGVLVIGSATVGSIKLKPGCFRIGNSGGMMEKITASSVGYVSKSGVNKL